MIKEEDREKQSGKLKREIVRDMTNHYGRQPHPSLSAASPNKHTHTGYPL